MLRLWCAGKLGNCPKTVKRFRFTCLFCRWRRKWYGKYVDPPYWIEYVFLSQKRECVATVLADFPRMEDEVYVSTQPVKHIFHRFVRIDPRGHFTRLRCAIIIVLDKIMLKTKIYKPLAEFCEFFANYPII